MWRNLNALAERNSACAAKTTVREGVRVVQETTAASFAGWTSENINIVCKHNDSCTTVKRLNTFLAAVLK